VKLLVPQDVASLSMTIVLQHLLCLGNQMAVLREVSLLNQQEVDP
jgi:hypothetical protein